MPESITSYLPLFACLASLAAVPLLLLFRRELFLREGTTFVAAIVKFGIVLAMLPVIQSGKVIECTLFEIIPGLPIAFRVDGLGMLFALVASALWIVTSLYAIGYMRGLKEHSQTRFFVFFAVSLSATLGVAFAGNLLTLYLFYEMLSLATYPLVTHHGDKEARGGGRTYLSHLLGTSVGFALPAVIFTYWKSGGDIDFGNTAGMLADSDVSGLGAVVLLMAFAFGFSKAGMMPFHSWLPGAMVAPTPVSALLHAVAVVKVGVFCVLRVVTGVFGVDFLKANILAPATLAWTAAFTVVVSSLIALSQDNLKRRLAFSTIGQLSYIILGAALISEKSLTGSMFHIATHAAGKITLFFCAGAIFVATGKKYISQMEGLGRKMPITFTAFTIGALSVIGLPATGGLISKFYLVTGAAESPLPGHNWLVLIFLISTILNAAYFLPIIYRAFFPRQEFEATADRSFAEAPWACVVPLSITAVIAIVLFFNAEFFTQLAASILPF